DRGQRDRVRDSLLRKKERSMLIRSGSLVALALLLHVAGTGPALPAGRCDATTLIPILRQMDHRMTFRKILTDSHTKPENLLNPATEMAILAEGDIEIDTADDFRRFLQANPVPPGTAVYLSSGGGNFIGGLKLGTLIRERRLDTVIGRFDPQAMSEQAM